MTSADRPRKRALLVTAAGLLAAVIVYVLVSMNGLAAPSPNPAGGFSFAALGDAPYYFHEELQFRLLLRHLDAHDLASVIHIGDIFWRPCTDAMLEKSRAYLEGLRHPAIYTPGDNEWSDCWEPQVGGYVPLERLASLRRIMYANPPKRLWLARQPGFVENARWTEHGVVFATVHILGSHNAMKSFPGRTAKDDAEVRGRTAASAAWIRETFAIAAGAPAVVIAFHAGAPFAPGIARQSLGNYQPFLDALEEESARFGRPVLVVHGDQHQYRVDRPSSRAPNLVRLEVPGSPDVGWVRVTVKPGAAAPFSFEKHIVPEWKYW